MVILFLISANSWDDGQIGMEGNPLAHTFPNVSRKVSLHIKGSCVDKQATPWNPLDCGHTQIVTRSFFN